VGKKSPIKWRIRKMQRLTTANSKVENSNQGLKANLPIREKKARQFIEDSFKKKMPALIPFALESESVVKLASYLLKYTTGSKPTLYQYVFGVHRFCNWRGKSPDEIIKDVQSDSTIIDEYVRDIDNFIGDLQAEEKAPGTINNHVKGVKALFRASGITLTLPHRVPKRVIYPDRAPTPEELTRMMDIAGLREKVIVSILALSGVRVGTLVKLQYSHVKHDLERGTVPLHLHIEAEITKGKYGEYDTFIGAEGIDYLRAYLNLRRIGNERVEAGHKRGMSPEVIVDSSPLIRNEHKATVESITTGAVHYAIHSLYRKAGLIQQKRKVRYNLRAHSIRKYFKTQLSAISTIPPDYVEYMMGHKISTYHDVKMMGIEHLRNLYASSGLSIRPRTAVSKIDQLKTIVRSLGLNPDEVLSRDALIMPHRTVVNPENRKIEVLNQALKRAIVTEIKQQTGIL
jgi:integrase